MTLAVLAVATAGFTSLDHDIVYTPGTNDTERSAARDAHDEYAKAPQMPNVNLLLGGES